MVLDVVSLVVLSVNAICGKFFRPFFAVIADFSQLLRHRGNTYFHLSEILQTLLFV